MLHGVGKRFRRSILEKIAGRAAANGGTDHMLKARMAA